MMIDVPPGVLQIVAVLEVVFECVDRDDGPVVVVERIVVGRDVVAHPLREPKPVESLSEFETGHFLRGV
jgi:hypothetical protein